MSKIFNDKQLKDLEKELSKISGREVSVSVVKENKVSTHEQARDLVRKAIKNLMLTFKEDEAIEFGHEFLNYITQQEEREKALRKENRVAINQSNSWYKKYAKQSKLLKLYKRLLEEGAFIPNLKGHRTLSEIKELENE